MQRAEKSEKPLLMLTKTENQKQNWRKPQTKTEKPQFLTAKKQKPDQKLAKSAKPKIPTSPSRGCEFRRKRRLYRYCSGLINRCVSC